MIEEISSRKLRAEAGSFCLPALWICVLPKGSPRQPGAKTQSSLEGRRDSRCPLSCDLNSSAFQVAGIAGVLCGSPVLRAAPGLGLEGSSV